MSTKCRRGLLILLTSMLSVFFCGYGFSQETPPALISRPAKLEVIQAYLNKLGYTKTTPFKDKNIEGLAFMVKDKETDEILKFTTLINPNDRMLKFECHDLVTVPPNPERLMLIVQKLTELNGTRTIGKYYVNFTNGKVQYFYFNSVLGGICFADFQRTMKMIEFIIFNDLKDIRSLVAS